VFNNLVNLCINWVKTAGSTPDAVMILGLFSQKNLKNNIDRELYWIVHFYLEFCCASSEWYSNNQNYEVKQSKQCRIENSSCKPKKQNRQKPFVYNLVSGWLISKNLLLWNCLAKWNETWWETPMEGSVLSFLKAEWKVSNTGSAHWSSS
jgi:hypothetical protein